MLKFGGHFVCKFYQGAEDKALELQLKKLFAKVHREKPESSRSVSDRDHCLDDRGADHVGIERVLFRGNQTATKCQKRGRVSSRDIMASP